MSEHKLPALSRQREAVTIPTGPPKDDEWRALKEQAAVVLKSGMAPKSANSIEKILTIVMKGREVGIPPMQALSHIHVVEGKPTMSAELMAALVHRAGHHMWVTRSDNEACKVSGLRRGEPESRTMASVFTMDDAKKAGVAGKGPWRSYPAAMLRARAISSLCRFAFADVLMGVSYTPEELGDEPNEGAIGPTPTDDAEVVEHSPYSGRGLETEETAAEEAIMRENDDDEDDETLDRVRVSEIEDLSLEIWGERRAVEREVKSLRGTPVERLYPDAADKLIANLTKVAERKRKANDEARHRGGGDEGPEGLEEPDPQHPDQVEGVSRGGATREQMGGLPATKKQLNYLDALLADVAEDGSGRANFEEMMGKPVGELTRDEASEWISRLSGRAV